MNTIKCRVKQNEYQDIGKRGVTPAEALVLRAIHAPAAHKFASQASGTAEAKNFWKVLLYCVAEGEAVTVVPDPENPDKFITTPRTVGEELSRLRNLYPVQSRTNPKLPLVDELFPGLSPQLPQTFQEIDLTVAPPDAKAPKAAKGHGPEAAKNVPDRRIPSEATKPKANAGDV